MTGLRLAIAAILLAGFAAGYLLLPQVALLAAEQNAMVLVPNGPQRPDDFGVTSRKIWLDSGGRQLQGSIVEVPAGCPAMPVALLIFHGRGETISMWARAQAFLSGHCVGSMVFDYSGHGASAPPAHVGTLNQDARTAYAAFLQLFHGAPRRCILGHSMGNAPMLNAYESMSPAPDCVVVANAFSSLEDFARASGAPGPFAALLGDVWDNTAILPRVRPRLLVIHSEADTTIPPAMAVRLDEAAPPSAQRIALKGFSHDAVYEAPAAGWWAPVLDFLQKK